MLVYVEPSKITKQVAEEIKAGLGEVPLTEAVTYITSGSWKVFKHRTGVVVFGIPNAGELEMVACTAKHGLLGWHLRKLVKDIKRLALDWECHIVKTTCYHKRHTQLIVALGGYVRSMEMVILAEG